MPKSVSTALPGTRRMGTPVPTSQECAWAGILMAGTWVEAFIQGKWLNSTNNRGGLFYFTFRFIRSNNNKPTTTSCLCQEGLLLLELKMRLKQPRDGRCRHPAGPRPWQHERGLEGAGMGPGPKGGLWLLTFAGLCLLPWGRCPQGLC